MSAPRSFLGVDEFTVKMLRVVVSIAGAQKHEISEFIQVMREESFIFKVVELRAKSLNLDLHPLSMALITVICSNPAEAVMHVHGAKYLQLTNNLTSVGPLDLVHGNFSDGLILENDLKELWEKQKLTQAQRMVLGSNDNFLDYVRG